MSVIKVVAAILASTVSAGLTYWGIVLIVRGATDPYDSPASMFYLFGATILCVAVVIFIPVVALILSPTRKRGATSHRNGGTA
jgi:ABC-type transport system involved in multi-copper enzyme maturation permease subunit